MVALSVMRWWSSGITAPRMGEGAALLRWGASVAGRYSTAVRTFTVAPSSVEV